MKANRESETLSQRTVTLEHAAARARIAAAQAAVHAVICMLSDLQHCSWSEVSEVLRSESDWIKSQIELRLLSAHALFREKEVGGD
jgi:hypothetical protein